MRLALPAVALVSAALLLAGCFGPSAPLEREPAPTAGDAAVPEMVPVSPEEAGLAPQPRVTKYPYEGRITGTGAPGVGYLAPAGAADPHIFAFNVTEGAVALVAELRWESPMHDLDLELAAPGCDVTTGSGACFWVQDGSPGAGDSPVRFVLTDAATLAQPGDWTLYVWAKDAVNTAFDGAISVFYGLGPSDDYTALQP